MSEVIPIQPTGYIENISDKPTEEDHKANTSKKEDDSTEDDSLKSQSITIIKKGEMALISDFLCAKYSNEC